MNASFPKVDIWQAGVFSSPENIKKMRGSILFKHGFFISVWVHLSEKLMLILEKILYLKLQGLNFD